jgi:pimeloyl-ACP methyl ester carboxylesterase
MRWLARSAHPPEAALRNPLTRSLLAGPAVAQPWRYDPDLLIEATELFADNPGFEATLPHVVHAQPRGLTTLETPVLVLWGKLDVILLPRQGRRFERLIPGAELRYISGAGHVPMTDVPDLLADSITEFALGSGRVGQDRDAVADDLRVGEP